jgi:cyclase
VLKKRLIFVLYFNDGVFCLSRNFRLQKVGNVRWLFEKFHFKSIERYIDEIVILDVSRDRGQKSTDAVHELKFVETVNYLMRETFIPLTIGGGIRSMDDAKRCFTLGADKILLNSPVLTNPQFVRDCITRYGAQAVVGAIDVCSDHGKYSSRIENGQANGLSMLDHIDAVSDLGMGEILLNSIDRDGTGMGFDLDILTQCPQLSVPLIFCGGGGKPEQFDQALQVSTVDAVATGNLFNFVGNGFQRVRELLIDVGHPVRVMDSKSNHQ